MKLGPVAVGDAIGAVLVHTTRAGGRTITKGTTLLAADVDALHAAGLTEVVCARIEADELDENTAAAAIAAALVRELTRVDLDELAFEILGTAAGIGLRVDAEKTGRANVRAAVHGLFVVDEAAITRANSIDEAITIATLSDSRPVRAGEIVATVKIIPFAVKAREVYAACETVRSTDVRNEPRAPAIRVSAWVPRRAGLVLTQFPSTVPAILDRATAALRTRLARVDSELAKDIRVAHEIDAVADAIKALAADGCDPIMALGASAIMDRRDVVPAALRRAGGEVTRFGMPVDPGNLLLLGTIGHATFIGLPGCARSLARSGFDWVLERVIAGLPIAAGSIAKLGVGGLLDEAARPTPRDAKERRARGGVAAVVLAAGKASRMGDNKLLADLDGRPLVHHAVSAALASQARPVVVVTGNDADRVRAALDGLDVTFVHNDEYASGMASSLRAGIAAVGDVAGALVCLGDMPRVTADHLARLIGAFAAASDEGAIVVPTCERKRGNPVLWGRRRFAEIGALSGDVGARALIERNADRVTWVAVDDPAILIDVDTPDALDKLRS